MACLAGVVMTLASPPVDFFPALWLGMAGLAYVLEEPLAVRRMSGAARGLAFGFAVDFVASRFVPAVVVRFTPLPWIVGVLALALLATAQGLRWMVAAIVREQLARRGVAGWLAFAAGVYVATFVPAVFPWTPAGALSPWPVMIQLADIVGERGVTFLIALSAGLLATAARAVREGRRCRGLSLAAVGLALPVAMLAHGTWRMRQVEAARARAPIAKVGLVQPGTDALERWKEDNRESILARLTSLTKTAEARGVVVTIWPEAAYPIPVGHWTRRCPIGKAAILPFGVRGPVLTGLIMTSVAGDLYNSAAVCSADGELSDPYDKLHLLPFGETIPVLDRIPWVRQKLSRSTRLRPGTNNVVQAAGPVHASVLNCFEDILVGSGRQAMDGGPNLLVNITNDAWFVGGYESELHLRFSVLRAVEERRDLVRAVNLGPTTWIDATGRVRARYDSALPAAIVVEPALLETPLTLFGRLGDGMTALAIVIGLVGAGVRARTKRKERHPSAG
jgi:apolipoprotein N-acyltransferase